MMEVPSATPRRTLSGAVAGSSPRGTPSGAPESQGSESPSERWSRLRRKLGRILLWCGLLGAIGACLAGIAAFFVLQHYSEGLPSVEKLKGGYDPPQVTRIYAGDKSTVLQNLFSERRTVVPFSEISDVAKLAFLAAEDATFYEHEGLNYLGLLRAMWVNLRAGHIVQGGSTITSQVVKNILLDSKRTAGRKLREWILARRLEQFLTKDEILSLYLNQIYLGHGRYGIEEASRYYFNLPASQLDVPRAALLAGIAPSPERYSPRRSRERALSRRKFVLGQMRDKGFLTPEYYAQVVDSELVLGQEPDSQSTLCPEAVEVAKDAIAQARKEHPSQGGYNVTTTIRPELQLAARAAVRKALAEYAERHALRPPYAQKQIKAWGKPYSGKPSPNKVYVGVVGALDDEAGQLDVKVGSVTGHVNLKEEPRYNPQQLKPSEFAKPGALLRVRLLEPADTEQGPALKLELGPQAALVALDVRSRDIVALVGSEEALPGGLDRARRARRQPGSSFKPIVYAYALRSHLVTPATVLDLEQPGHGLPEEPPYRLSVRNALAHSNNEASVWLLRTAGPAPVVTFAHELGIQSKLGADLSLALGSYEVTPLEMANAYATFASGGLVQEPRLIAELRGPGGEELPLPERAAPRRVLEAEEAYLVTSLLQSVVKLGTGQRALAVGHPVAGKTGTSNDNKDTWFVGYTTDLSVAVWVGYDDTLPLGPGNTESGARTALPAFVEFMKAAVADRPRTEFPRPAGIVTTSIDPTTGYLPDPGQTNGVEEEFLDGTAPETSALEPSPDMAAKMPYKPQPGEFDALPP
jgi:penicillin-binding protein 1A